MYNSLDNMILTAPIIRVSDIKGVEKRTLQNKMQSLVNNEKIVKIKNGLYAMVNPLDKDIYSNKFEIATSMYEDAYIIYHTALEFYGLSNQIYNLVQVATKNVERKRVFNGYTFEFYNNMPKKFIDTINQNSVIRVTSIERTIVDCINKPKMAGGIEEVSIAISGITYIDDEKLLEVLEEYNNSALYNKTGFLLSKMNNDLVSIEFYKKCKKKIKNDIVDIRENKKLGSYVDKEWNILTSRYIVNEEY